MKSILLASASAFAFAGAAAAEVSFAGSATLGHNSLTGSYWDASVDVTMSQELDNGLTAGATFGINVVEDNLGEAVSTSDYELSLTSETAGLYFGDTGTAAGVNFSAPSGLDGAPETDFDGDIADVDTDNNTAVLRGEMTFGAVSAAVSYGVNAGGDFANLQASAKATFGAATVSLAYQDADHDGLDNDGDAEYIVGEAIALGVSATVAGADVNLAYLQTDADTSVGIGASYPVGPVTLGAYYTSNEVAVDAWGLSADYDSGTGLTLGATYDSTEAWEVTAGYAMNAVTVNAAFDSDNDWSLEGSYDVGNGLMAYAGVINAGDDYYVAATYDLGGGASVLMSHGVDDDASEADEIGAGDYKAGTTVEVSFSF